jgi:hypothetical protein
MAVAGRPIAIYLQEYDRPALHRHVHVRRLGLIRYRKVQSGLGTAHVRERAACVYARRQPAQRARAAAGAAARKRYGAAAVAAQFHPDTKIFRDILN